MKLANLKILSMTNPMGIDKTPYFSYVLTSEKNDVIQIKYSVTVRIGNKVVWRKIKQAQQSTFIQYEGELKSKTKYDVEITVIDNYGESDTIYGYFETALLNKTEWKAQWVKSTLPIFDAEKGFGKQPPATMFQKQFSCGGKIKSARLYCTCQKQNKQAQN